ncbi:SAM-dependent methyltransferase, partial [Klebsiella pneumoniae]|uniref:SAM-dependent methyltransferase n=1 Tax=Klebsiella pneumoniae TaxID=573 RepID=UPI00190F41F3
HRTRAELAALLSQVDLVEPGLVWTPQWRPEGTAELLASEPTRSATYAAVGRIRA